MILYLMSEKGFYVLKGIASLKPQINYIVSAKDVGTLDDSYEKIKSFCNKNEIKFYSREHAPNLKNSDEVIAIGWKWLINCSNTIVLHDSLLPKYRGFNPLVTSLINGDKEIGVTALYATDRYDEGDIIFQEKRSVEYPFKIQQAIDIIKQLYLVIVEKIFYFKEQGLILPRKKQNDLAVSYSLWRDTHDYYIDWSRDSEFIKRFIDAIGYPYLGARSKMSGESIVIEECEVLTDVEISNRDVGKIIFKEDGCPVVVCGKGLVKLTSMKSLDGDVIDVKKIRFRTRFTGRVSE